MTPNTLKKPNEATANPCQDPQNPQSRTKNAVLSPAPIRNTWKNEPTHVPNEPKFHPIKPTIFPWPLDPPNPARDRLAWAAGQDHGRETLPCYDAPPAMPELPEVERARRLADRHVVGKRILKAVTVNDLIVYEGVVPRRFASALKDRRVKAACRRGKYLWLALDRRPWPLFHFGMTGSFQIYMHPSDRPRFFKIELLMEDGTRLAMPDPRRLGHIRLLDDPEHQPPISKLGFDPLLDMPSLQLFVRMVTRRKTVIKALLLDQSFSAGVGNWIADEVLYQARIAPHRRACDLKPDEIATLRACLGRIVRKAVAVDADKARFPKTWLFHHRWSKNRNARTARRETIIHQTLAGRTTAWVPNIQR